jgi:hypothetical protein
MLSVNEQHLLDIVLYFCITECGGKFTIPVGSIHSPNYPDNYDKNLDCRWLIDIDKNYVIWFAFADVDMPTLDCEQNFVKVSAELEENLSNLEERSSLLFMVFRIYHTQCVQRRMPHRNITSSLSDFRFLRPCESRLQSSGLCHVVTWVCTNVP